MTNLDKFLAHAYDPQCSCSRCDEVYDSLEPEDLTDVASESEKCCPGPPSWLVTRYHVLYTDIRKGSMLMASFESREMLNAFVGKLTVDALVTGREGAQIDAIFYGTAEFVDPSIEQVV